MPIGCARAGTPAPPQPQLQGRVPRGVPAGRRCAPRAASAKFASFGGYAAPPQRARAVGGAARARARARAPSDRGGRRRRGGRRPPGRPRLPRPRRPRRRARPVRLTARGGEQPGGGVRGVRAACGRRGAVRGAQRHPPLLRPDGQRQDALGGHTDRRVAATRAVARLRRGRRGGRAVRAGALVRGAAPRAVRGSPPPRRRCPPARGPVRPVGPRGDGGGGSPPNHVARAGARAHRASAPPPPPAPAPRATDRPPARQTRAHLWRCARRRSGLSRSPTRTARERRRR